MSYNGSLTPSNVRQKLNKHKSLQFQISVRSPDSSLVVMAVLPVGDDEPFGRCTECSTALRMDSCPKHTSALLTLESSEERSVKLLALKNQLSQIADLPLEDVTDVTLLSADRFKAVYNIVTKEIVEIIKY